MPGRLRGGLADPRGRQLCGPPALGSDVAAARPGHGVCTVTLSRQTRPSLQLEATPPSPAPPCPCTPRPRPFSTLDSRLHAALPVPPLWILLQVLPPAGPPPDLAPGPSQPPFQARGSPPRLPAPVLHRCLGPSSPSARRPCPTTRRVPAALGRWLQPPPQDLPGMAGGSLPFGVRHKLFCSPEPKPPSVPLAAAATPSPGCPPADPPPPPPSARPLASACRTSESAFSPPPASPLGCPLAVKRPLARQLPSHAPLPPAVSPCAGPREPVSTRASPPTAACHPHWALAPSPTVPGVHGPLSLQALHPPSPPPGQLSLCLAAVPSTAARPSLLLRVSGKKQPFLPPRIKQTHVPRPTYLCSGARPTP